MTERDDFGQLTVDTAAPTVKQDVLEIKITRNSYDPQHYKYIAYYENNGEKLGKGSTPYMAVLDLINNHNTTEEWDRQNGFD